MLKNLFEISDFEKSRNPVFFCFFNETCDLG